MERMRRTNDSLHVGDLQSLMMMVTMKLRAMVSIVGSTAAFEREGGNMSSFFFFFCYYSDAHHGRSKEAVEMGKGRSSRWGEEGFM